MGDAEVSWRIGSTICTARLQKDGHLVNGKYWKQEVPSVVGGFTGERRNDAASTQVASSKRPAPVPAVTRKSFGQRMQSIRKGREKAEMADFIVGNSDESGDDDKNDEDDAPDDDDEASLDQDAVEKMEKGNPKRGASKAATKKPTP